MVGCVELNYIICGDVAENRLESQKKYSDLLKIPRANSKIACASHLRKQDIPIKTIINMMMVTKLCLIVYLLQNQLCQLNELN